MLKLEHKQKIQSFYIYSEYQPSKKHRHNFLANLKVNFYVYFGFSEKLFTAAAFPDKLNREEVLSVKLIFLFCTLTRLIFVKNIIWIP